jgi:hypothetical protein
MDLKVGWEGVYWMLVVQDSDQWQAVMNIKMNLGVLEVAMNITCI